VPARIRHLTVDCRDPAALARFWAEVLGFTPEPPEPDGADDTEALITDPKGHHPGLLFIAVPEAKTVKNRLHLDLQPSGSRDGTVERLVGLGGTVVDDRRTEDGAGWVVMADPEGNELCIERSAAERDEPEPVDTGERVMPPVHAADERTMLTGMLDWYREGVLLKVDGVSPEHAAAMPLRSSTSIAGLVKHLALVEDSWFTDRFAGRDEPEPWASADWDADPDWEFHSAVEEPLADSVALYQAACARSRAIAAEHGLDDVAAETSRRMFTLRYALLHLLEETARHLGHLDLLREHLDGTTGE
jgi:catechol 2,3-dioxygenase-like lactoylglutathione lyase family enzyme